MEKLGLIGGLGPESTLDYYKLIIKKYQQKNNSVGTKLPEFLISSVDLYSLLTYINENRLDKLTDFLLDKVNELYKAGATFCAIGTNTPHVVYKPLAHRSPIPVISIVDATFHKAKALNLKKLLLLGTKYTMTHKFYQEAFTANSIELITPNEQDINRIDNWIFSELEHGVIKSSTKNELLSIIKKYKDNFNLDGVILGCTELPLILTESSFGLEFLNTTDIHSDALVDYMLNNH
ncbi:aspartate/glutamate racemase family protein [Clostridium oryzae]|uniref:Putative amino-acid racemase n=1 Tax=Clostridium oryzae TaxID=1450648 RepID=A0A1V4IFS3_9CLOT|nr:amino acid racemase [Clostridium oryzae]OPJ58694.1 putative amino-acid racemase [Clostridium oryzae]